MTFLIPCPSAGVVKTLLGSGSVSVGSFVFSDFNFGTEDPDRYLVIATSLGGATAQASGCLVDGVAADLIIGDGGNRRTRMWGITKPAGTTGTIQVTGSGDGCGMIAWSLTPLRTTTPSQMTITWGIDPVTTPEGGVTLAAAYTSSSGTPTISLPNMDLDASQFFNIGSNLGLICGASRTLPGTDVINLTFSGGSDPGFVAASFQFS